MIIGGSPVSLRLLHQRFSLHPLSWLRMQKEPRAKAHMFERQGDSGWKGEQEVAAVDHVGTAVTSGRRKLLLHEEGQMGYVGSDWVCYV